MQSRPEQRNAMCPCTCNKTSIHNNKSNTNILFNLPAHNSNQQIFIDSSPFKTAYIGSKHRLGKMARLGASKTSGSIQNIIKQTKQTTSPTTNQTKKTQRGCNHTCFQQLRLISEPPSRHGNPNQGNPTSKVSTKPEVHKSKWSARS